MSQKEPMLYSTERRHIRDETKWNRPWNRHPSEEDFSNQIATFECFDNGRVHIRQPLCKRGDIGQEKIDNKVEEWLDEKGDYAPTGEAKPVIRVLLCQRKDSEANPSMSRDSYEKVERHFQLHESTLPSMRLGDGSMYLGETMCNDKSSDIQMVLRPRGKNVIGNILVSLHYDKGTNCTTAWICSTGLIDTLNNGNWNDLDTAINEMMTPWVDEKQRLDKWEQFGQELKLLVVSIIGKRDFWKNPLLFPAAMLEVYTLRAHAYVRKLDTIMRNLEHMTGGNSSVIAMTAIKEILISDNPSPAEKLSLRIDPDLIPDLIQKLIFVQNESLYMVRCLDWLTDLSERIKSLTLEINMLTGIEDQENKMKSFADHWGSVAKGSASFYQCMIERSKTRVALLYTLRSEQNADLLYEINEKTAQDSNGMLYLTFIAAFYLPLNSMAAVFSMPRIATLGPDLVYWVVFAGLILAGYFIMLYYFFKNKVWKSIKQKPRRNLKEVQRHGYDLEYIS